MREADGIKGCGDMSVKEYTKLKEEAMNDMKELFPEIMAKREEPNDSSEAEESEEKVAEIK